ncbi:GIY-YIG nuclease family protein [Flagellimonas aequoris]|uniref:GIY-YIG nuclease family protein n=1 Tax=Flagellimonas aequoris TaxID=2306997 RepID=A0A418NBK7_9FLAO|nr:GIY-YIG nuclease family protein [Allomuricauda aequoris]RIV73756.1 GIY-YIG nuclease family protein [Allomuricauda aequoris]TXK07439.1 GIY-YIG nuclease family protein [Allomuricauda aequoris]
MNKEHIISELIRTTSENDGKPLSMDRFREETGIRKEDWYGIFWTKWSDAQIAAGLEPNQFGESAINLDEILLRIVELTRQLGRIPTKPEFQITKRSDSTFPSVVTIRKRLGNKDEIVKAIHDFCLKYNEWDDVLKICNEYIDNIPEEPEIYTPDNSLLSGHVYLLKHGKEYKIGRSTDAAKRYKEIKIQMPFKTEEIHVIETDDTVGIEAYWHKRFAKKRLEGEWFALNNNDIKAFKRRRFM